MEGEGGEGEKREKTFGKDKIQRSVRRKQSVA